MRHVLKIHPDSQCAAVSHIEVDAVRPRPTFLELRYFVSGRTADLNIPALTTPARTDKLWQHTCFEAFVRASPNPSYLEFNFAPSMEWAAYRFNGHRNGMSVASGISPPHIKMRLNGTGCELRVSLELDGIPDLLTSAPWSLGLSAVIEETGGRKSFWALAHPPGNADFHHPDCFALELPAA
jgi:hypothetical protein